MWKLIRHFRSAKSDFSPLTNLMIARVEPISSACRKSRLNGESIMKLLPLLDRTGNVKFWADPRSSWMVDLDGNAVALIAVDAVYGKTGVQLGWWYGDHLRNRNGQVVLFVSRSKIEGLMMPAEKPISRVPILRVPSGKPNFERPAIKTGKKHEWADLTSLPFQDRSRRTLAQIKRVLALAAENHARVG